MEECAIKTPHLNRRGLILFRPNDVVDALSELQAMRAKLLGVDRFEMIGDEIQPTDQIDLSSGGVDPMAYERALAFVKQATGQNTVFELVWD